MRVDPRVPGMTKSSFRHWLELSYSALPGQLHYRRITLGLRIGVFRVKCLYLQGFFALQRGQG